MKKLLILKFGDAQMGYLPEQEIFDKIGQNVADALDDAGLGDEFVILTMPYFVDISTLSDEGIDE